MFGFVLVPRPTGPGVTEYALASFLARYRGATLRACQQDLLAVLRWCASRQLEPLQVQRPHLELYLRWMEQQELAPATIGRRFGTVAGFFKYAVSTITCRTTRPWRSPDRGSAGKLSAAPCCTRWSTPRCSPQPAKTGRRATPWSRCWGCWAAGQRSVPR